MKFVLDTHSHTIASGHAYSSVKEMIDQAAIIGLELLCITDHAPMMPGSTHPFYFSNLGTIPEKIGGVEIFKGVEANIMNHDGDIDLEEGLLKRLDVVIASFHPPCYESGTKEENTQVMIKVMKNPYIHIIGHPDDSRYPIDYEIIVQAAKEEGVLLEVNNSSLKPRSFREGAAGNIRTMLAYCKQYEVPITIGSDAHFYTQVGGFDLAKVILQEMDMPEKLIANTSVMRFKQFLNRKPRT